MQAKASSDCKTQREGQKPGIKGGPHLTPGTYFPRIMPTLEIILKRMVREGARITPLSTQGIIALN